MKVFGIDPGSERTGYGCVETDGRRHHLVACGAIAAPPGDSFPNRLARIHAELTTLLAAHRPDCVAIENLFHANNVRSAAMRSLKTSIISARIRSCCPITRSSSSALRGR